MDESIHKSRFIDTVRSSRAQLDALLAEFDEARMTRPGACGDWSVKDVLAHVTWHEREMIHLLQAHALEGSDLWSPAA